MPLRSTRPIVPALVAVVLAFATLAPAPAARAATGRILHVSPDGSDPDRYVCQQGSQERPWNNISDAFRCVQPGDTIYVHAGTYREVVALGDKTPAGTEKAPILLTGAPGEPTPVIEGSLRVEDPSWWTIQDLEIVGDAAVDYDAGGYHPLKVLGGHDWTVQRVHVHDAATYALVRITPASDGVAPANWRFLDSCVHDTIPLHGTPDEAPYPDHNMYVHTGVGAGPGLIEGNVLFSAPNGQNLKLGNGSGQSQADGADHVTVRNNTLVGAAQNITVVGPSDDDLIERNILAEVDHGEPWYPNVRGIYHSGHDVVARDNAWSGAAEVVRNQTGVTTGVIDGGNLAVDPGFLDRGCDGFTPSDPAAASYGADPQDLSDVQIPVDRLAGDDRVDTAIKVSRDVHRRADLVLLARADAYPDALASSALAGLYQAPVLLTARDGVPDAVLDELARLEADRVVLLGGPGALSPAVEDDLRAAGIGSVTRIQGQDRNETATRVADRVRALRADGLEPSVPGADDEVILVEGANPDPSRGWPDAVSAGQLAAATGAPVLLTEATRLPEATRAWLAEHRPSRVTIVGGTVAVSAAVASRVDGLAGRVTRIFGADRYATSELVASELASRRGSDIPPPTTFVASGRSFPDAMAVGPAAALSDAVVVLYGAGQEAYDRLRDFVAPVDESELEVVVVGGPAAVPDTLELRWKLEEAAEG